MCSYLVIYLLIFVWVFLPSQQKSWYGSRAMHDSAFAAAHSQKEAAVCSPESVRDRIISIPNTAGALGKFLFLVLKNLS